MEIVIILLVCVCLVVSYLYFGNINKTKREREGQRLQRLSKFYDSRKDEWKDLEVLGMSSDGNSDFEFIQAVRKIDMPDYVRIEKYE